MMAFTWQMIIEFNIPGASTTTQFTHPKGLIAKFYLRRVALAAIYNVVGLLSDFCKPNQLPTTVK